MGTILGELAFIVNCSNLVASDLQNREPFKPSTPPAPTSTGSIHWGGSIFRDRKTTGISSKTEEFPLWRRNSARWSGDRDGRHWTGRWPCCYCSWWRVAAAPPRSPWMLTGRSACMSMCFTKVTWCRETSWSLTTGSSGTPTTPASISRYGAYDLRWFYQEPVCYLCRSVSLPVI